jgi:hypothetical protein
LFIVGNEKIFYIPSFLKGDGGGLLKTTVILNRENLIWGADDYPELRLRNRDATIVFKRVHCAITRSNYASIDQTNL